MEYAEYFSNLYEKYKDTSKDAVEDKKHFKYDFYNLVLDSLQIKEDYEKHFTSDHILSDDDISFLEEFTSFIMNDSSKKDSNSKAMARGVGKKKDRNNGRQIINRNFDPYSEILLSIFTKFNKTISKDINNSFCLENNPIVQIIFKKITKDRIKQISDSLVKRIDSLPAPFFFLFFFKAIA